MKLPNPDRALVDLAKLRDYCLNPDHEDGKHKARVFASALGLSAADAPWLRDRLLSAAFGEAQEVGRSRFGVLYMLECAVETAGGRAIVRSGWIVRAGEDFPRLATCFDKSKL